MIFESSIPSDPFVNFNAFVFFHDQTVHLEAGVDRVPALVDQRAGRQIVQRQMLEHLADHLRG